LAIAGSSKASIGSHSMTPKNDNLKFNLNMKNNIDKIMHVHGHRRGSINSSYIPKDLNQIQNDQFTLQINKDHQPSQNIKHNYSSNGPIIKTTIPKNNISFD